MPSPRPDSFPRQYARTRRFSLGEPRAFRIVERDAFGDGVIRVLFLRSSGGSDPVGCLWLAELHPGRPEHNREVMIVDPQAIGFADGDLPPEERARRERMRETASGITAFATDRAGTVVSFALAGTLVTHDLISAHTTVHAVPSGVVDPRVDPTGTRVAYLVGPALRLLELGDGTDIELASDPSPTVSWGAADFVAAEEHHRFRGFWWSPDGTRLLAQRTDVAPVGVWWLADPTNPEREPTPHRYPAAGTANAEIGLSVIEATGTARGQRRTVVWDTGTHPYLTVVGWTERGLALTVQDRRQLDQRTLLVDPDTGAATTLADEHDDAWIDVVPGLPVLLPGGRVLTTVDTMADTMADTVAGSGEGPEGTRRLAIAGSGPVTPAGLQVDRILHTDGERVVAVAHATTAAVPGLADDTTRNAIVAIPLDGGPPAVLAGGADDPGVHDATVAWPADAAHPTLVVRSVSVTRPTATITVLHDGIALGTIANLAETPLVTPAPHFARVGRRRIPTALLLPTGHTPGTRLPVLLDPYGGPHAPRVLDARNAHTTSQWFADQGFAVVVADNRGVPGPGPAYEKAVNLDLAAHAVEDQADALAALAADHHDLDTSRVAVRGWSFGGYLAALCVLRRPDVFHAGIAGAPVTDWRLYDTAYTERYLGHPDEHPEAYERSSIIGDAPRLQRPLMIIHGLVDDNVVVAHSLRLSHALLAAGRPHELLPLSGVTHMTPQEEVAENLLLLQLDFLRRALGLGRP